VCVEVCVIDLWLSDKLLAVPDPTADLAELTVIPFLAIMAKAAVIFIVLGFTQTNAAEGKHRSFVVTGVIIVTIIDEAIISAERAVELA
jgi:hypothetical protein